MALNDAAALPLWSVIDNSLCVDYGRFNLVDDEAEPEDAILQEVLDSDLARAGEGWIALVSDGSGHHPQITLEAWEVEPAPDSCVWDHELVLDVTFLSDQVRLFGTANGGTNGPPIVLPPSDNMTYRVRIQRRSGKDGRNVDDLYVEAVGTGWDGSTPLRLEEWRFQFWPKGQPAPRLVAPQA